MQITKRFGLVLLLGLLACGDSKDEDGEDEEGDVGTPTGATCPTGSTLTYDNFGKEFFATYCNRCHASSVKGAARFNAPTDHNFDTLNGIQQAIDHIDQTTGSGPDATNTAMPPNGAAPTKEERAKLSEWLACGAD